MSTDTKFELLSHHRRRTLLTILRRYDEPLALADLADEVAIQEHDKRIEAISAEVVQRIYVTLYYRHIQKLANHDVVTYDQNRDLVALSANTEYLTPFLDLVAENN